MTILSKLIRAGEGRTLKELEVFAQGVGQLESSVQPLSDEQLRAKTADFRERLDRGASVDDIAAEAFATMREAAQRVLGMRPTSGCEGAALSTPPSRAPGYPVPDYCESGGATL